MKTLKTQGKLSRAQITEALDSVPVSHILGKQATRQLTPKQRAFAVEVAKGSTKADAFRKAYPGSKSKHTLTRAPYIMSRDERIKAEIEAYQLALETEKHRTPAALRSLVIQSLVGVITNPDSKPGQITAAAKVLGTVTEVAAFTERKEIKTITSSEDARQRIMAELRALMTTSAEDVNVIEADAASLLVELEPHPSPGAHVGEQESRSHEHTIPLERSSIPLERSFPGSEDPTPSDRETPPVGKLGEMGEGGVDGGI